MSSADDVSDDVLTTPDDVLATLDDAANDLTESLSPLKPENGQSLRKNVDDASNDSGTLPVVSASTEEPPMVSHDVEVGLHDAAAAEKHTSSEPQVTESPSPPEQAQLHGPNADKSDELFATPTPVAEDSIQPPQPQIFRPWTPSYSVTTQAPGTPHTEEVAEPVVIVSEIEDPAIETRPEADVARPKSPWTPSYSVVVQGSPNIPPIELEREVPTEHTETTSPDVVLDTPREAPAEPERPKSPFESDDRVPEIDETTSFEEVDREEITPGQEAESLSETGVEEPSNTSELATEESPLNTSAAVEDYAEKPAELSETGVEEPSNTSELTVEESLIDTSTAVEDDAEKPAGAELSETGVEEPTNTVTSEPANEESLIEISTAVEEEVAVPITQHSPDTNEAAPIEEHDQSVGESPVVVEETVAVEVVEPTPTQELDEPYSEGLISEHHVEPIEDSSIDTAAEEIQDTSVITLDEEHNQSVGESPVVVEENVGVEVVAPTPTQELDEPYSEGLISEHHVEPIEDSSIDTAVEEIQDTSVITLDEEHNQSVGESPVVVEENVGLEVVEPTPTQELDEPYSEGLLSEHHAEPIEDSSIDTVVEEIQDTSVIALDVEDEIAPTKAVELEESSPFAVIDEDLAESIADADVLKENANLLSQTIAVELSSDAESWADPELPGSAPNSDPTLQTPSEPIERPKSPWTPSYSVTTQGPGIPPVEDAVQLPDPIVIVSEALEAPDTQPGSDIARPKSPWTPSYSVVVQGSPNVPPIELKSSSDESGESYTLVEDQIVEGDEHSATIEQTSDVIEETLSPSGPVEVVLEESVTSTFNEPQANAATAASQNENGQQQRGDVPESNGDDSSLAEQHGAEDTPAEFAVESATNSTIEYPNEDAAAPSSQAQEERQLNSEETLPSETIDVQEEPILEHSLLLESESPVPPEIKSEEGGQDEIGFNEPTAAADRLDGQPIRDTPSLVLEEKAIISLAEPTSYVLDQPAETSSTSVQVLDSPITSLSTEEYTEVESQDIVARPVHDDTTPDPSTIEDSPPSVYEQGVAVAEPPESNDSERTPMVDTPGEVKSLEILASTVSEPQDDITIDPLRIEDSPPGLDEEQGVPVAEPSILATEPPAIEDNDDIPQETILEQASLPESADNSFSVALETLTSVTGSLLDESKEIITTDQEDVLSENPSNSEFNEAMAASADVPEGLSSRDVALEVIIDSDDNEEKEATPTDQEDTSTETASLSEINEPMASVDLLEAPSNGQATPSTLLSEVIPVSEPIIAYESKEKDLEIVSAGSNPTLDSQDVPSTARDVVLESTEDALTPPSEPVERPRSPWTPSYSVTTQGPGIPLPQDILSEVSNALAPEVPPESNPPSRPWTPSYSVVVQGSPSVASANLETHVTSSELPIEALTVAETLENDRILPVTLADAPPELPVDLLAREELVDIAPSFTELASDASEPVIAELAEAGQPLEESQAPSSDAVPVSNAIEPELLPSGESARISLDSTPQGGLFSGSNDGIEPSASAPSYSATTQDPEQVEEAPSAQPTLTFSDVPHDTRILEDVPRPISPRAPSYSVVLEGSQVVPPIESEEPGPAIVDPSTLRDPDVESQTYSPDLASDAVVAALVESGVIAEEPELLAQDTKVHQGDVVEESAPVGAEATIEPVERPFISPEIQDVIAALETPREEQTVKAPDDAVAPQPKSVGSTNQHTPLASAKSLPEPFPLSVDVPEDANDEDDFVPPLSPRTRLESTASSLFFPGGWFSKLPEGRPSLEVAAGEFSSPKPASPSVPSKPTSPSVPSPPAEEVVVEAVDRDEKKGKWCVVM